MDLACRKRTLSTNHSTLSPHQAHYQYASGLWCSAGPCNESTRTRPQRHSRLSIPPRSRRSVGIARAWTTSGRGRALQPCPRCLDPAAGAAMASDSQLVCGYLNIPLPTLAGDVVDELAAGEEGRGWGHMQEGTGSNSLHHARDAAIICVAPPPSHQRQGRGIGRLALGAATSTCQSNRCPGHMAGHPDCPIVNGLSFMPYRVANAPSLVARVWSDLIRIRHLANWAPLAGPE
ncbi:hypothetical protein ACCO45_007052 [Purpureocillium lilacinum]|uniref:Uncharacterized protein n=1 Tax=Purpureocillium lilacinum TaxID=33203 RepID=A0ACC4DR81_PURLI